MAYDAEQKRKYHEDNRDRILTYKKEWYKKNPNHRRAGHYKEKYGLSIEAYNLLWCLQRGKCAICGNPETNKSNIGKERRLAVDHDHETGEVRSLLCNDCNIALGKLKDDPLLLSAAKDYLEGNGYVASQDQKPRW